ncbi:MAG: hypothetical protein ACE5F9_11365 [Phycisphaerae bacterium]
MLCIMAMAGCSGGDAGFDIRKAAADRPDLDAPQVARGTLSLPKMEPFNLTSFVAEKENDANGTSMCDSMPVGADGARCKAEVHDGAKANARFLLGYMFDNTTSQPLDAVISVRLKFHESVMLNAADTGSDVRPSSASTSLMFQIKDTNGTVVRTEHLIDGGASGSRRSSRGSPELSFDARFEPGRGYYLAAYGKCHAAAGPSQTVAVSLEITDCKIDIDWRPGAAVEALRASTPGASPTAVIGSDQASPVTAEP